jgi:hypothetical protein
VKWQIYEEHWSFIVRPSGHVEIECETINRGNMDFKTKRAVYKEFRRLIKMIEIENYRGWIGKTYLGNARMMKIFTKIGAIPFIIKGEFLFFVRNGGQ